MELGDYPFSERYGWTQDRYGLSWQIMAMGDRPDQAEDHPTLMFVGEQAGKAEAGDQALHFGVPDVVGSATSIRYGKGEEPDKEGTIRHAGFTLEGQEFAAMDSAHDHHFTFNEAISFLRSAARPRKRSTATGRSSPRTGAQESMCGWLKDKFGVSWQIAPSALEKMLRDPDIRKVERVTEAFLKMKKFDIAELEKAYRG